MPKVLNCDSASMCISRQPSLPAVVVTKADDIITGRWCIAAAYESCSAGSRNTGRALRASTSPTTVLIDCSSEDFVGVIVYLAPLKMSASEDSIESGGDFSSG